MKVVQWTSELSVGHDKIDLQHKLIVGWLKDFSDAVVSGKSSGAIETILKKLISYAKYHFTYEEMLMKQANYDGLKEHHQTHENFKLELGRLLKRYNSGALLAHDLQVFMNDWVSTHIATQDQKYSSLLKNESLIEELIYIEE